MKHRISFFFCVVDGQCHLYLRIPKSTNYWVLRQTSEIVNLNCTHEGIKSENMTKWNDATHTFRGYKVGKKRNSALVVIYFFWDNQGLLDYWLEKQKGTPSIFSVMRASCAGYLESLWRNNWYWRHNLTVQYREPDSICCLKKNFSSERI